MDDFLPFFFFMVLRSFHNKKLRFSVDNGNYTFQSLNHEEGNLKLQQLLIKSDYYIVPK